VGQFVIPRSGEAQNLASDLQVCLAHWAQMW
jgi:hypothetical protein